MSEEKIVYVCVSRTGVVVPMPEGGSLTLREGDEVEGNYYEQVAKVVPSLVLKTSMSKEMLAALDKRKAQRSPAAFPKRMAEIKEAGGASLETVLDSKRQGVVENFRGAIQDAMGAAKNEVESKTTEDDASKS